MAKIETQLYLTYDDVLIKPQYSDVKSRRDVDTTSEILPGISLKVPLVASNMETVISIELAVKIHECGGIAILHQFTSIDEEVNTLKIIKNKGANAGAAIGTTTDFEARARELMKVGPEFLLIDTPHAHSENCLDAIKKIRKLFPSIPILAGTVATKKAAIDLFEAGADGLKVGIGAGAACLTRVNAGVGVPQLHAVIECSEIAKKYSKSIFADGGIKIPGSFAKAIGAGASCAIMGTLFAGTDEAPSDLVEIKGRKFKRHFGSASSQAKIFRAQKDDNFKSKPNEFVEGGEGLTQYQGPLDDLIKKFDMGLRSAMSYSGAHSIKEFQEKCIFIQLTSIGLGENHDHGILSNN